MVRFTEKAAACWYSDTSLISSITTLYKSMMELSLAEILFEGVEDYTPDKFALLQNNSRTEKSLLLVNKAVYLSTDTQASIASYATTRSYGDDRCDGATEINYVVASEAYPKAGYTMYCCMSSVFGYITSDRTTSTSNPAKATWKRIERDADWESKSLDNFYNNDFEDKKEYYDVEGRWPDREFRKRQGPRTPPEQDDCEMPGFNSKLGTADAWKYTGSLDVQGLLQAGKDLIQEYESRYRTPRQKQLNDLFTEADGLFRQKYTDDTDD